MKKDQKSDEEILNNYKENYEDFEVLASGSIDLKQNQDKINSSNKLFQKQESQIESSMTVLQIYRNSDSKKQVSKKNNKFISRIDEIRSRSVC